MFGVGSKATRKREEKHISILQDMSCMFYESYDDFTKIVDRAFEERNRSYYINLIFDTVKEYHEDSNGYRKKIDYINLKLKTLVKYEFSDKEGILLLNKRAALKKD